MRIYVKQAKTQQHKDRIYIYKRAFFLHSFVHSFARSFIYRMCTICQHIHADRHTFIHLHSNKKPTRKCNKDNTITTMHIVLNSQMYYMRVSVCALVCMCVCATYACENVCGMNTKLLI